MEDKRKVKKMTQSEGIKAAERMFLYFEKSGASGIEIFFFFVDYVRKSPQVKGV